MGGIESVHRGPAVESVADIRRDTAEQWLSLIDAGEYTESWKTAAEYFQAAELVFPSHPDRRVISTKKTTEDARRYADDYEDYSERMLHLLWSIIVGFIVGLIASAIMHTHMGFIGTTLLGIIGSVVGGLLARLFSRPAEGSTFHPAGFLMSIIGAIVVVFLVRLVGG